MNKETSRRGAIVAEQIKVIEAWAWNWPNIRHIEPFGSWDFSPLHYDTAVAIITRADYEYLTAEVVALKEAWRGERQAVADLSNENERLHADVATLRAERDALRNQLIEITENREGWQEEITILKSRIAELEAERDNYKAIANKQVALANATTEGSIAAAKYLTEADNPYPPTADEHFAWRRGFFPAMRMKQLEKEVQR